MLNTLKNRYEQGYRTCSYPKEKPAVFPRYRGKPIIQKQASPEIIKECANACPQDAIDVAGKKIDMGRCVFCGTCERISKGEFVKFTGDFEISTSEKADLLTDGDLPALAQHSKQHFKKLFGRSLQLRQVS
ncbi:MAG: hydrogenase, partial [Desulfobacteraceae bacterium]|nr:hydrogenase [Desulfobacteraceae bacterium]